MPKKTKQPKYTLHKASGNAIVRINGKQIYLGKYDSPESFDAYDRAILQWKQENDFSGKHSTTIGQLCLAFMEHAEEFYVDADGKPTGEADNFRNSLKLLIRQFRSVPCSEFGPRRLIQLQQDLSKKHVRTQTNKMVSRIRMVFKFGVMREMVPVDVLTALQAVPGLRKGRGKVKEARPVVPVPDDDFNGAVKLMTTNVAGICRMLYLTGARVSEIRTMRVGDIDTSGKVWLLKPGKHKNAWRGKDRVVFIGPKAQAVLMPFIGDATQADLYVFRPRDENEPYTLKGLGWSIRRACKRAKVNHWSPGQLRHNTATNLNKQYGDIDASRVILGHSEKNTTQIYAERDHSRAAEIAWENG